MTIPPHYYRQVDVSIETNYDPALTLNTCVTIEKTMEEILRVCFPNRGSQQSTLNWVSGDSSVQRFCNFRPVSPFPNDATLAVISSTLRYYFRDEKVRFVISLGTRGD